MGQFISSIAGSSCRPESAELTVLAFGPLTAPIARPRRCSDSVRLQRYFPVPIRGVSIAARDPFSPLADLLLL